MVQPETFLRRDLEKVSHTLGTNLLPAAFQISGRIFVVGYEELKEAEPVKGRWRAEVLLGEVGKDVIGGMTLYLYPDERITFIDYTHVEDRRHGIGSAMVKAVEKDLKDRGYRESYLLSTREAISFWKSLGYQCVGIPDSEGGQYMDKNL